MKRVGLLFLTILCGFDSAQAASRHALADKMLIVGTATLPLALLSVVTYKKAKAKLIKLREQMAAQNKDETVVTLEVDNVPQEKPAIAVPKAPSHGAILREMCKDPSYLMCSGGLLTFIAFVLALPINDPRSSGGTYYGNSRYQNYTSQQQYQPWNDPHYQDGQKAGQQGPQCLCDETENLRCAANCQDTANHLFCPGCYAQLHNQNCSWCDMTHLKEPQQQSQEPLLQTPAKPAPVKSDAAVTEIAWDDVQASNENGDCPTCLDKFASGEKVWVCASDKRHMWHAQCEGLRAYEKTDCTLCRHTLIELHKVAQKPN
jgi:hypothetical protein